MAKLLYEWDETKRVANLVKHGVDFDAIRRFDWTSVVAGPDLRHDHGEVRTLAYGLIDSRVYAVVFTQRERVRRIISLRKANPREQRTYRANFPR